MAGGGELSEMRSRGRCPAEGEAALRRQQRGAEGEPAGGGARKEGGWMVRCRVF